MPPRIAIDKERTPWYKPTVAIENGFQYQSMRKHPAEHLTEYLEVQGLKSTRQREHILRIFASAGRHLSAEELYLLVRKKAPRTGYATVYRTLKLLTDAGLADERRFDDGVTRYEYNASHDHHDHLICTKCGRIIEFENEQIEQLQQQVAERNQFLVQNHRLELYGLCGRCRYGKRR
jgi:Fur family ferric uptake transcriptional regulator